MRVNPDNAPDKQAEYRQRLTGMSDADLWKETKDKIWLSAYANNNPRSCYHWQCDATYDEWQRRDGHADRYSAAHTEVVRANT